MTGNLIAIAALVLWPVVAAVLYKTRPVYEATIWTILGGMLFLPSDVVIKIPMVPAFNKDSIPNVCAFVGCIICTKHLTFKVRRSRAANALIIIYIFSPLITSLQNNDAVVIGRNVLEGVGTYDGVSAILEQFLFFCPFLIGRYYLGETQSAERLLRALVIAALIYTLPMLFELRMSPVLSDWIYGHSTFAFGTDARYGGFRPVVFMHNGLVLAFFITTCFLASIVLLRTGTRIFNFRPAVLTSLLAILIAFCKAAGALIYCGAIGPLALWTRPRTQVTVAVILVSTGLLYPILRYEDAFPTTGLVEMGAAINSARADSLKTRFAQENRLLARASERPWFGWGRYGRSRVYAEDGTDISLTDGFWVITLGQYGIVGFLALFGLLALPVYRARLLLRNLQQERQCLLWAMIALILSLTLVEQLPNASLGPWGWLFAGTLLGQSERNRETERRQSLPGSQTALHQD